METAASQRRKDLFGDCALVEIIHLHDCLRGALKALQQDVSELSQSVIREAGGNETTELERRVAGRFKVIWSVFRAHSAAEDEFIWPALQNKQRRLSETGDVSSIKNGNRPRNDDAKREERINTNNNDSRGSLQAQVVGDDNRSNNEGNNESPTIIEQEEYEEDHADEEKMFRTMDTLLSKLRAGLLTQQQTSMFSPSNGEGAELDTVHDMARAINDLTASLSKHLMAHLEKEETQCMPLVLKHLNADEINELVGQIMGKRSSDTIAQIMTMAVQNLNENDRNEMVRYMKKAMVGTFFERWLSMSGWMKASDNSDNENKKLSAQCLTSSAASKHQSDSFTSSGENVHYKRQKLESADKSEAKSTSCDRANGTSSNVATCPPGVVAGQRFVTETSVADVTSQGELERLIRVIASNPELSDVQKNTTIQGLRDSVWKNNLRQKQKDLFYPYVNVSPASALSLTQTSTAFVPEPSSHAAPASATVATTRMRRGTAPLYYFKKNKDGITELVWSSESSSKFPHDDISVPLFSASELAPTYHDGATGAVLGCPHYARACKLRHPSSGRLYTCRLCCEQERENPMKDQDCPMDRYAVTEYLCMRCGALQPASDKCINPKCESRGKPYAKYSCTICNLHDDGPHKNIYHCPFCNVCRSGLGLGIDYRHCMRCNACVSLADDDHHCIPQRLQGSCPICHESMFQSTEPLRGLKCGHVMHLSCFNMYIRGGQSYTCPLCKKSVEDMRDYITLLDAAVRMQPMPQAYSSTISKIYCQDCEETGEVQYHFVGNKCPKCGSYNTRELGRVQGTLQIPPS